MTANRKIWALYRNDLAKAVASLGYPEEFADLLAKQLGSPKAIDRMTAYLRMARPGSIEMIVDEMLAIRLLFSQPDYRSVNSRQLFHSAARMFRHLRVTPAVPVSGAFWFSRKVILCPGRLAK